MPITTNTNNYNKCNYSNTEITLQHIFFYNIDTQIEIINRKIFLTIIVLLEIIIGLMIILILK